MSNFLTEKDINVLLGLYWEYLVFISFYLFIIIFVISALSL